MSSPRSRHEDADGDQPGHLPPVRRTPSQTLADRIGVDPVVVSAWLHGQQEMTTHDIDALADGLGITPWELIEAATREAH